MWEVFIKVIKENKDRVMITAVREPVDQESRYSKTYRGIMSTPQQRTAILRQIKKDYTASLNRQARHSSFLAGFAQTTTNALNDWENE